MKNSPFLIKEIRPITLSFKIPSGNSVIDEIDGTIEPVFNTLELTCYLRKDSGATDLELAGVNASSQKLKGWIISMKLLSIGGSTDSQTLFYYPLTGYNSYVDGTDESTYINSLQALKSGARGEFRQLGLYEENILGEWVHLKSILSPYDLVRTEAGDYIEGYVNF